MEQISDSAMLANRRRDLARWQRLLLGCAVCFVLLGYGLRAASSFSEAQHEFAAGIEHNRNERRRPSVAAKSVKPAVQTYFEGAAELPGITVAKTDTPTGLDAVSPFFLAVGFGFFLGFCAGFALRSFFKLVVVTAGLGALGVAGLSYAEVLDIHWGAAGALYDGFVTSASASLRSTTAFIQGELPALGSVATGLLVGFKRC